MEELLIHFFSLYVAILKWSIESERLLVVFFNFVTFEFHARYASTNLVGFHNFKLGKGSIIIKYDDSKSDKNCEHMENIFYCQTKFFMSTETHYR